MFKKKPSKEEIKDNEKIKNALTHDQLASISTTILGMAYILGTHLIDNSSSKEISELPDETKYALVQVYNWIKGFREILESKEGKIEYEAHYAQRNLDVIDKTCEKRLIFLVTNLYEELKREGKIPK